MKKSIILFVFFFLTIFAQAQQSEPNREVIGITQFSSSELMGIQKTNTGIRSAKKNRTAAFVRYDIEVPISDITSFMAFAVVWEAQRWDSDKDQLWIRFKNDNKSLTWQQVKIDVHSDKNGRRHVSELTFVDKDVDKLDVKIVFEEGSKALVQNLKLHFYNPGTTQSKKSSKPAQANNRSICTCPQPDFESRADWCPTGDCPENPSPSTTNVTHLIVHHSAGTNTSSDWAGVVRSIWDFHVNVNGWSDIGYNYLVDPNGVLYEGRGDNIQGAHFCGANAGTMGVCMMGDFTNNTPTNEAKGMLKNLLAWKICDIDADPEDSAFHASSNMTLNRISGHQDGCATACPGASFYPQLPDIRSEVSEQIDNDCEIENLAAPTNLTADVVSSTSVKLEWEDNSNNENKFIIQRSVMTNNNFVLVGNTDENVNTFVDQNLQPNTAYFYQVRAENTQEFSEFTNQVGVATVFTSTKNVGTLPVEIYPNPVKDWLSIQLAESVDTEISINIFEMGSSKLVRNNTTVFNGSTIKYDLSDLPKGVYLLQLSDGEEQGYVKLVKQ